MQTTTLIPFALVVVLAACAGDDLQSPTGSTAAPGSGGSASTANGGAAQGGASLGGGGLGGSGGGQGGALPDCGDTTVMPNAYYVDVNDLSGDADDANDGKLVSEGGTGPWASWAKLAAELEAGSFQVGDWIYLRGGTYVPTAITYVAGDGSTAVPDKITISGYPGETAVIDTSVAGDAALTPGGDGPIHVKGGNVRFQNLSLHSDGLGFSAGRTGPGVGVQFACIKQTWSGTPPPGENFGVIKLMGAPDFLIESCDFEGGVSGNANGSTVYMVYAPRGVIRNSILRKTDVGQVIYVKKNAVTANVGDIVIENNLLVKLGQQSRGILHGGWSRFAVRNNIFACELSSGGWFGFGDSGGNQMPIGAENLITHNTFYSAASLANGNISRQGAGTFPTSGEGNTLADNIFMGQLIIFRYDSGPHATTTDYNLYRSGGQAVEEYNVDYGLAGWQSQSGGDANSVEGTPVFATTPVLDDPSSFALAPSSPGYQVAGNGADIGADVSKVGPLGM